MIFLVCLYQDTNTVHIDASDQLFLVSGTHLPLGFGWGSVKKIERNAESKASVNGKKHFSFDYYHFIFFSYIFFFLSQTLFIVWEAAAGHYVL